MSDVYVNVSFKVKQIVLEEEFLVNIHWGRHLRSKKDPANSTLGRLKKRGLLHQEVLVSHGRHLLSEDHRVVLEVVAIVLVD